MIGNDQTVVCTLWDDYYFATTELSEGNKWFDYCYNFTDTC